MLQSVFSKKMTATVFLICVKKEEEEACKKTSRSFSHSLYMHIYIKRKKKAFKTRALDPTLKLKKTLLPNDEIKEKYYNSACENQIYTSLPIHSVKFTRVPYLIYILHKQIVSWTLKLERKL